jgi:hypothetical protein
LEEAALRSIVRLSGAGPLAATVLGLALFACGCQKGPAIGIVQGEVTFGGQPLKDGRVLFTPADGQGQTGGATITDGKFTATMPVAKMKVAINANRVIGKKPVYEGDPKSPMMDVVEELIPPKYNVNTELELDVKEGEQTVKYELKAR